MANVGEYIDIMNSIKQGKVAPIYLLNGEEPYYIDKISKFIENNVIEEHERDFNLTVLYGREVNAGTLLETVKRFPMMATRQVVILREAQDFDGVWSEMEAYFADPLPSTVLVIDYKYKKVNARNTWVNHIKKNGVFFVSDKLYPDKIPRVIEEIAKSMKYRINPAAAQLMAEYLGTDLEKIEGEIKKLTIKVPLSKEIGIDDVKENIGISKEFNSFDFADALAVKNVEKSYYLAYQLGRNEANNPMVLIIYALFGHFSKVMMYHSLQNKSEGNAMKSVPGIGSPYMAKRVINSAARYSPRKTALIIEKLREIDARSKGVNSHTISSKELLKELTFFILN